MRLSESTAQFFYLNNVLGVRGLDHLAVPEAEGATEAPATKSFETSASAIKFAVYVANAPQESELELIKKMLAAISVSLDAIKMHIGELANDALTEQLPIISFGKCNEVAKVSPTVAYYELPTLAELSLGDSSASAKKRAWQILKTIRI
jgi:hypothetical protein